MPSISLGLSWAGLMYIGLICLGCDEDTPPLNVNEEVDSIDMNMIIDMMNPSISDMGMNDMNRISEDIPCPFVMDSVCDEPAQCPLGSDEVDCQQACSDTPADHVKAVCHYYENRDHHDETIPMIDRTRNIGHISGVLTIPSGASNARVARHYRAYIPHDLHTKSKIPLLFMLPGHRVALDPLAHYTQLVATADTEGFIVVFVEQEFRSDLRWAWWTDWNWTADQSANHPDIRLLERLIDDFSQAYPIDVDRVYVSGHSRGGAMALIAAIERPDLFAGAIIQSGFTEFAYEERLRVPEGDQIPTLLFIHGVEDPDICIDCRPGRQCAATGRTCGQIYGADGLLDRLRGIGWPENKLQYYRLEGVAHRWQPQLNAMWWTWLREQSETSTHEIDFPFLWPQQTMIEDSSTLFEKVAHAPLVDQEQMLSFEGGNFAMGVPFQSPQPYGDGWYIDWTPEFDVTVPPFYLDRTEVSVQEYAQFLSYEGLALHYHPSMPIIPVADGYKAVDQAARWAMHYVTWENAQAYCRWAGKRLPYEKEFEWVATVEGSRSYPWTERGPSCERAAAGKDGTSCLTHPADVDAYQDDAPPSGVLGLIGNVAEWMNDSYQVYPNALNGIEEHIRQLPLKVVRGGSFYHSGAWLRGEARWMSSAEARGRSLGFRCAWDESMQNSDADLRIRGELSHAQERMDDARVQVLPLAPLFATADENGGVKQKVNHLMTAVDFTPYQGGWAIAERDLGRIIWFNEMEQEGTVKHATELSILWDGLQAPRQLATMNHEMMGELIWVGDELGKVTVWGDIGIVQEYEMANELVDDLVADTRGAAWAQGNQVFWINADQLTQVQTITLETSVSLKLTLHDEQLVIASSTQIVSLDRLLADESVLLQGSLLNQFNPMRVSVHPETREMTTIITNPNWPHQGLICTLLPNDTQQANCTHYSPPRAQDSVWVGNQLIWETYRSIAKSIHIDDVQTYDLLGLWHRPVSLQVKAGTNEVLWLDSLAGSLYQIAVSSID